MTTIIYDETDDVGFDVDEPCPQCRGFGVQHCCEGEVCNEPGSTDK